MATLTMRSRRTIPAIGLGVYKSEPGPVTKKAVLDALQVGYRHIDTAAIYNNEADVGEAIAESGLDRSDVFITTKLWNDDQGYDKTLVAFDRSLEQLGLDYVDLYLIHWPVPELRLETWRALERLTLDGRVKDIGVSNYMVQHLEELVENSAVVPAVNQIELSPFNYRSRLETINICHHHDIVIEAYSPLTKGRRLDEPVIREVGERYGKTPAQVLIRWALEKGFVVLPKSIHTSRIAENFDVFDFALDEAEIARLDDLDEALATGWDPLHAP